jgi:hypothetical protein
VQYNTKRGYYFTVPGTVKHIPAIFGHASMQGKKWILSTDQLETLNIRCKESLQDIYLMTERVIEGLMAKIRYYIFQHYHMANLKIFCRKRLSTIYKISESVAFLDMISR